MNETDLQSQINELRKEINDLKGFNTISREIETAFRERLGDIKKAVVNSETYAYVVSPGDTLNLPVVDGALPIIVNGKTYNVLYQQS